MFFVSICLPLFSKCLFYDFFVSREGGWPSEEIWRPIYSGSSTVQYSENVESSDYLHFAVHFLLFFLENVKSDWIYMHVHVLKRRKHEKIYSLSSAFSSSRAGLTFTVADIFRVYVRHIILNNFWSFIICLLFLVLFCSSLFMRTFCYFCCVSSLFFQVALVIRF